MTLLPLHHRSRARTAAAVLGALLALAGCGDPVRVLPREGAPEALEFTLVGYESESYLVGTRGDTVVLRRIPWAARPGTRIDSVRVVPTPDAWRAFWSAAERAGVDRWRRRYVSERVVDGLGWELRIVAGGRTVESEGTNAYPDRYGREHEVEPTEEFEAFRAAVGALVGRPL